MVYFELLHFCSCAASFWGLKKQKEKGKKRRQTFPTYDFHLIRIQESTPLRSAWLGVAGRNVFSFSLFHQLLWKENTSCPLGSCQSVAAGMRYYDCRWQIWSYTQQLLPHTVNMRAWDKVLWARALHTWTRLDWEWIRWSTCGQGPVSNYSPQLMCLLPASRFFLSTSVSSIMPPSLGAAHSGPVPALLLLLVCPLAAGYNLDVEHSLEFTGPSSSMFGYSVLLHHHGAHNWSASALLAFYFLVWICDWLAIFFWKIFFAHWFSADAFCLFFLC